MRKKSALLLAALIIVIAILALFAFHHTSKAVNSSTTNRIKTTTSKSAINTNQNQNTFNKSSFSTTDPTSIWIIVNKQHPLNPKNYTPSDLVVPNVPLRTSATSGEMHLRKAAAVALEKMVADANQQGIHLMLASGYRSYSLQVAVYGSEVKNYGQARADSESARPGYSEHQTGLAADLEDTNRTCEVTDCFANLPEGKWLAANAYKYGFIIRYPADKVDITGYRYEPWHIRYIGTDLSNELHQQGVETLEEFFGVSGGPNYN